jgi:fumarylacetoacetase
VWVPVPEGSDFTPANLPYGVVRDASGRRTAVARIGDHVVALADVLAGDDRSLFAHGSLDAFIAAGPARWREVRARLFEHLADGRNERPLTAISDVEPLLPFTVADYTDFYASIEHATNLGRILRPGSPPLLPNWRHLPVAYHGRAGTVAVSGTPVRRPCGLVPRGADVERAPTRMLDFELELGFVVGAASVPGRPVRPDDADRQVFGVVLLNDWSARDIQAFEYQPLGPFLGKSFLTSISPWIVPLGALAPFLTEPPPQEPEPDPFLRAHRPWALDLSLEVELCATIVTRPNARHLYWTFAQQLAHLTSNGAPVRSGDLFATGTVSDPYAAGSMIELTWRGERPLTLADGTTRTWLHDGDEVVLRGHAGDGPARVGFGEVRGGVVRAKLGAHEGTSGT